MTPETKNGEEHKMGVLQAISYVVGTVVGAGIFQTPTGILQRTNSVGLALIVWVLSGLLSVLGAFCYLELGTSIRESGADFTYLCFVGWRAVAFAFMFVNVLITYPAMNATFILTFGEYVLVALDPVLCVTGGRREIVKKLLGFLVLSLLTMVNLFSLKRYASRLQIFFTTAKLLAVLIVIFTGVYYLFFLDGLDNYKAPFQDSDVAPGNLAPALFWGLWAYYGYDVLNGGIEEVKNPRRTMPLAILGGMAIITITYLTMNIAYFAVLDRDVMLDSDSVAIAQGDSLAQQFASKALGVFAFGCPVLIGIVLCGDLNSFIFVVSRRMFAAARMGHLPWCFSLLSVDSNSPRVAIIVISFLTMAMTFVGNLEQLIDYVIFLLLLQSCASVAALLWIRYKHLQVHETAMQFPLFIPLLYLGASVLLIVIPIYTRPLETAFGALLIFIGFVVYHLLINVAAPRPLRKLDNFTLLASQKLLLSMPQRHPVTVRSRKNVTAPVKEEARNEITNSGVVRY